MIAHQVSAEPRRIEGAAAGDGRAGGAGDPARDRGVLVARRAAVRAGAAVASRRSTAWSARSTGWRWTCSRWSSRWRWTCASSSSVIRINADLERVGDQAVNIAGRVQDLGTQANVELPVDIPRLAQLAGAMVRKALQAFIEGDAAMAESVLMLDDQVDDMNRDAFRSLGGAHQGEAGAGTAGAECADHLAQPGARRRPCDQHRGGCDLLGARRGCAAP